MPTMERGPEDYRLMVVRNPASTQAAKLGPVLDYLGETRWGDGLVVVDTIDADIRANAEHIAGQIREGDIVVAGGGDATAYITLNALMLADEDDILKIDTSFGGADDISKSQNDNRRLKHPTDIEEILDHGLERVQSAIAVTPGGSKDTVYGQGHVHFGESGFCARDINTIPHRKRKVGSSLPGEVIDGVEVVRGIARRTLAANQVLNGFEYIEDGERRSARELAYSLLPRFAAAVRVSVAPGDPNMVRRDFPSRNFLGTAAFAIATEMLPGQDGLKGTPVESTTLTFLTPTMMQVDGEPYGVAPESTFELSSRKDAITTLYLPKD